MAGGGRQGAGDRYFAWEPVGPFRVISRRRVSVRSNGGVRRAGDVPETDTPWVLDCGLVMME